MTENSEPGTLSLEDAAMSLVAPVSQEEPDPTEEDADPALEAEAEAEEVPEDQPEDDADEDDATEDDDDEALEDVYLIDGEEVSESELLEWRKSGLRQSDYTKKTQEVSEERKALQAEKTSFNAERMRVAQELQQQQAQLKDALATFAVQSMQEPNWVEAARTMDPKAYQALQADWAQQQQQNAKAQQTYQALQQQQAQEVNAREQAAMLEKKPEWGSPDVFKEAGTRMLATANEFGFSQEEMAAISDHRMFLLLDAFAEARAGQVQVDGAKAKATKRVVQAAKRVPAGQKPAKNQAKQKQRRDKLDRARKTGTIEDAAAAILM